MLNRPRKYRRHSVNLVITILCCLLLISFAGAESRDIRILYVNDFHGFAEPHRPAGSQGYAGGAAYLAGRINDIKKEKDVPTLLLAAGDMIQGNLWANLNNGRAVIDLMNLMGFDAAVVGNHEFDFNQKELGERVAQADFPFLGANVSGMASLRPHINLINGGVRVGIMGLVTEHTPITTHPDNVTGLLFLKPVDVCRQLMKDLRRRSDIVVVLSHIGFEEDKALARQCEGIDVIIGGHSHTKIDKPVKVGDTIVLQAWEHAKALGVLNITLDENKVTKMEGYLEEIRPSHGKADKEVEALVSRWAKMADELMNVPIGRVCRNLDNLNVRQQETALGNLVADAVREASGADMALINAGSIRNDLKKGEVTQRDIHNVLPFDNYIVSVGLKGGQIIETLEQGLSMVEKRSGAFLQVSGLQVVYDAGRPPGKRVKEVQIKGRPLNRDQSYRVAVNDFMAAGGDGYAVLKTAAGQRGCGKGQPIHDVLISYIKAKGDTCPAIEGGRIVHTVDGDRENSGPLQ